MARPINDRLEQLNKRIKQVEEYNLKYNNNNKATSDSGINELKAELDDLLKEEAKRDRLRSLPLYSSKNNELWILLFSLLG
jgi:selenocysteine-specific translation elongation factor